MAHENCPRACDAVVELDLDSVFEKAELVEVFEFSLLVERTRCSSLELQPSYFSEFVCRVEDDCHFHGVQLHAVCRCSCGEVLWQCGRVPEWAADGTDVVCRGTVVMDKSDSVGCLRYTSRVVVS